MRFLILRIGNPVSIFPSRISWKTIVNTTPMKDVIAFNEIGAGSSLRVAACMSFKHFRTCQKKHVLFYFDKNCVSLISYILDDV